MTFLIKDTKVTDMEFYEQCFSSYEFKYNMYKNSNIIIENYIKQNKFDNKYIIKLIKTSTINIGFAHFYFLKPRLYEFIGGLAPCYFNSGLGLKGSIKVIDWFFSENLDIIELETGVYKFNSRSYRMLKYIGFKVYDENNSKYLMNLNIKDFNNKYVNKIKNGIKIYYENVL